MSKAIKDRQPVVSRSRPPDAAPAKGTKSSAPAAPVGGNGKEDKLDLKNGGLGKQLRELQGDAKTIARVLPKQDPKVVIVGTARSKPVEGQNGFADYAFGEKLGEELRKAGLSVGTGGGPGAMEAPLRGHMRQDALLDAKAARTGKAIDAHEPQREGANIILPNEQGANPFVDHGRLGSFDRFLFRMEFLFRNTREFVATPGGFGTLAEIYTYLGMKTHGTVKDPVLFGAPDDFFKTLNKAFEPLVNPSEAAELRHVFSSPEGLVGAIDKTGGRSDRAVPATVRRMRDELEAGFQKLDGKPAEIAFFGGGGPRSKAAAPIAQAIATGLAKDGIGLRVGGSPYIDQAVLDGARSVKADASVTAFAMGDAPVKDQPGAEYQRVQDVLTLRELMAANVRGLVVTPEGAKQIGQLFTNACDIQTGEIPKIPIVVIDPDGKFKESLKAIEATMLSGSRQYINKEDLQIFTVTTSAEEALKVLESSKVSTSDPVPPPDPMAAQKKSVAETAIKDFVKSGMKLGIGTGSTMKFAIDALGAKLKDGSLKNIVGVSTSEKSTAQATGLGIPLSTLAETPKLDLAIDGADEVATKNGEFLVIKGMGGALLREKDVAQHAKKYVLVVDETKLVSKLGTKSPLPVEVDIATEQAISAKLAALGGTPTLRLADGKPYVTDNGNHIIDVKWPQGIDDPHGLAKTLDGMAGVKAHGLFLGMADEVLVAQGQVRSLKPTDVIAPGTVTAAAPATPAAPVADVQSDLQKALESAHLPPEVRKFLAESVAQQTKVLEATTVMEAARARITNDFQAGKAPLAALDRTALPKTEDEAIEFLMDRLGLTAKEKDTVRAGLEAFAQGATLPAHRMESIGGRAIQNPETFRTQMAVTDPGLDHLAMTLADPRMLNGAFVHVEIIDRPTENTAPYSNPGSKTIGLIRMLLGDDAPTTVFYGRPNYFPSIVKDNIEGMDDASAGLKFNPATAANQLSNAARGLFNQGVSEVKVTMDGLSPDEVRQFGQLVKAQAAPQEGEYVSAAFNLNAVLKDFSLVPADAPNISGAPTKEQRALMLKGALQSLDAAKEGGFKKATVDSASFTPPSYPLIEYFGVENLLDWAHHAHELGLETYASGGMRDYHFPILQLAGVDGVGVGFSIHDPPAPDKPGEAGRLLPEKVLSSLAARDGAEQAPIGRTSVLVRMLDEKANDGALTEPEKSLRDDALKEIRAVAHAIDVKLDGLKKARDAANEKAKAMPDGQPKTDALAAAKKGFEDGFKALITAQLADAGAVAKANALLERGAKLGVNA